MTEDQRFFSEGYRAYLTGKSRTANPYPQQTAGSVGWDDGWSYGPNNQRKALDDHEMRLLAEDFLLAFCREQSSYILNFQQIMEALIRFHLALKHKPSTAEQPNDHP